jgi:hypothetical protein
MFLSTYNHLCLSQIVKHELSSWYRKGGLTRKRDRDELPISKKASCLIINLKTNDYLPHA